MDKDFKLQELKLQHERVTQAEKDKDSSSPAQEGKPNQHTRICIPTYKENDDLELAGPF